MTGPDRDRFVLKAKIEALGSVLVFVFAILALLTSPHPLAALVGALVCGANFGWLVRGTVDGFVILTRFWRAEN